MSTEDHDTKESTANDARNCSEFQQTILGILAEEGRYGLAIKRALEDYYDAEVNHGRMYPNLDDLVEMGFVEKSELDKRTNLYKITDLGREALVMRVERLAEQTGHKLVDQDHRLADAEPQTQPDRSGAYWDELEGDD